MSYRTLWTTPVTVAPASGILALCLGNADTEAGEVRTKAHCQKDVVNCVSQFHTTCGNLHVYQNLRNSKNHVAQKEMTMLDHSKTENNREHDTWKNTQIIRVHIKRKTGELAIAGRMFGVKSGVAHSGDNGLLVARVHIPRVCNMKFTQITVREPAYETREK